MISSAMFYSVPPAVEAYSNLDFCRQAGADAVLSIKCAKEQDGQQVANQLQLAGATKKEQVGCCSRSMFAAPLIIQQQPGSNERCVHHRRSRTSLPPKQTQAALSCTFTTMAC